jgi:hypothetical protein
MGPTLLINYTDKGEQRSSIKFPSTLGTHTGGIEVNSTHSTPQHQMKVNGQHLGLAILPLLVFSGLREWFPTSKSGS